MTSAYEKLLRCVQCVREKTDFEPELGLILGSGLGALADEVETEAIVEYADIAGFPVSTVVGHRGRFVFGKLGGVRVCVMQGRVHFYEGYDPADVLLPVRLMKLLGAKALFLTNAAGGVNKSYNAGDFMLLRDHIMTFFPNPLIGANLDELGPRFPDMSQVYDPALSDAIAQTAETLEIPLHQGVYCQLSGPTFETPAEVRMLAGLGADAVGMSTACEAAAARHAGMRVCGVSCITNKAAGLSAEPLSHEEVFETSNRVAPLFRRLVRESIAKMGALGL
ncbi:MAG: purine-nucleoside phosphorylase [Oscillospiraceae bacterium]|jgi:purine-nucleoside phosphorylase|nr:purine-nucleoside phosphorylase [Oscillospiraceae bacterium]